MSSRKFVAPGKVPPVVPPASEPSFDLEKAAAFIGGAQVKTIAEPAPAPAPAATQSRRPRRISSDDGSSGQPKVVIRDARYGSTEPQTEQFVVRFTRAERAALDGAFQQSGYRYLHQYVRSLLLPALEPHMRKDGEGEEG